MTRADDKERERERERKINKRRMLERERVRDGGTKERIIFLLLSPLHNHGNTQTAVFDMLA